MAAKSEMAANLSKMVYATKAIISFPISYCFFHFHVYENPLR